jgi:hypothetical protein
LCKVLNIGRIIKSNDYKGSCLQFVWLYKEVHTQTYDEVASLQAAT